MTLNELPDKEPVTCYSARQKREIKVAARLLKGHNYLSRNELTITDSRFPSTLKTETQENIDLKAKLKALEAEKAQMAAKLGLIEKAEVKTSAASESTLKSDEKPEWADLDLKGKKAYAKGLDIEFPKNATDEMMVEILTNSGK